MALIEMMKEDNARFRTRIGSYRIVSYRIGSDGSYRVGWNLIPNPNPNLIHSHFVASHWGCEERGEERRGEEETKR